jgi:hypothetical protein
VIEDHTSLARSAIITPQAYHAPQALITSFMRQAAIHSMKNEK